MAWRTRVDPNQPDLSVWWRKEHSMSAEIRQIVAQTWTDYIGVPGEWSREQTEEFFTEEATRIADRIARDAARGAAGGDPAVVGGPQREPAPSTADRSRRVRRRGVLEGEFAAISVTFGWV